MSQSLTDAAIVAAFRADLLVNFTIFAMCALIAYEYIITISQEGAMVWRKRRSLGTWIFIANRYLMIAFIIQQASTYTAQTCAFANILGRIFAIAQYVIFAIFAALRVFAIWDRNRPMALLVLALNLVPVWTEIYFYSQETNSFTVDAVLGSFCGVNLSVPANINLDLTLGTRIALIFADVLVLAATWHKTFKNRMEGARIGMETPLSSMLLRDGTVYFAAILAMNVAEVVVKTIPLLQTTAPIPVIISALIPILISRFLLNLRNVGEAGRSTMHDSLDSQFSAPEFHSPTWASIVGNMGEDLDHGTAEMEGWDDSDAAEETRALDAPSPERRSGAFITDNNDEVQEIL